MSRRPDRRLAPVDHTCSTRCRRNPDTIRASTRCLNWTTLNLKGTSSTNGTVPPQQRGCQAGSIKKRSRAANRLAIGSCNCLQISGERVSTVGIRNRVHENLPAHSVEGNFDAVTPWRSHGRSSAVSGALSVIGDRLREWHGLPAKCRARNECHAF